MPLLETDDCNKVAKDARNLGKYNRDIAQKIGAGCPFDAPMDAASQFSGSSVGRSRRGAPPVIPGNTDNQVGARAEAVANKSKMRGQDNLLGGYEVPWSQNAQAGAFTSALGACKQANLPPRPQMPERLLPQAMMKVQYDGGTVKGMTAHHSTYLNSKVLAEANRDRNQAGISLG